MKNTQKDPNARNCNQCGSILILIKKVVEGKDLPSPVTTLFYRCSNDPCQKEIDKKTVAQVKHYREMKKAQANRNRNRLKTK